MHFLVIPNIQKSVSLLDILSLKVLEYPYK